jgi:hypothetical protein
MDWVPGDGGLVEFAFASVAAPDLPPSVFLRLMRQTWSFNVRAGLTGELRFEAGRFFQVIEGPCATVQGLAARILADSRHGEIRVVTLRGFDGPRRYEAWSFHGLEIDTGEIGTTVVSPAVVAFRPTVPAAVAGRAG